MGRIRVADIQRELCNPRFKGAVGALTNGYFVFGGSVMGQHSAIGRGVGLDYVWDLWNEQFCAFVYGGLSANSSVFAGVQASGYVGFGSGRFDGVHSAWSGPFVSAQYSLDVSIWRLLGISAHVQGFSSPDRRMLGGLVGATAAASVPGSLRRLLKLPVGASISAGGGVWTPSDFATRLAARGRRPVHGRGALYLNLADGSGLGVASHMLDVMGVHPFSMGVAGYATAVALTKHRRVGQCSAALRPS